MASLQHLTNGSNGFQLPPLEGSLFQTLYQALPLLPTIFQPSSNYLQSTSIIFWPFAYALRSQPGSRFPVGWLYGCAALGDQKQWHQHLDDLFPKIRAKRGEVYPTSNTMSIWFVREDGSNLCKNGKVKREFRPSTFNLILSTLILLYSIRTICVWY